MEQYYSLEWLEQEFANNPYDVEIYKLLKNKYLELEEELTM